MQKDIISFIQLIYPTETAAFINRAFKTLDRYSTSNIERVNEH